MALNTSNSPVAKFEQELRDRFPKVTLQFVSTVGDLAKALGPKPSPIQASLYIHSNGTHQLAVSMGKNSAILLAPFNDSPVSPGNLNAALGLFTENIGQIPIYLIGNIPPDTPPCPVPQLCMWTATAVVRAAIGWRGS